MADTSKGATRSAQMPASGQRRKQPVDLDATGENELRFTEMGDWSTAQDSKGFDPYNSSQGKPNIDAWRPKRR
jgi:hypothetical protein